MKSEFIVLPTIIGVTALLASCDRHDGKRESGLPNLQTNSIAQDIVVARGDRNISELQDIENIIRSTPGHERSTRRSNEIRDAIINFSKDHGTSYGASLSKVFEDLSLNASEAEAKRLAKYLALMSWGDEDLLFSVLEFAPPGPLLEQAAAIAKGACYQTPDGTVKTYDLEKAYGLMTESPARAIIAVALVDRAQKKKGLSAALAVANSLQSDSERKAAAYQLVPSFHTAMLAKKPVDSGDISLLVKMAREVGVEEVLLSSLSQPNE